MKTQTIPFAKMAGTGNDFIVIDNRQCRFSGEETELFARLCARRISVGADGVMLISGGDGKPVHMRIFNSDGRKTTMCGNGARCAAFFARWKNFVPADAFILQTAVGPHPVRVDGLHVELQMRPPRDFRRELGVVNEQDLTEGGFIDTGVPHLVLFTPDVESIDLSVLGRMYRHHPFFSDGVNVNIVQLLGESQIRVRTYERGVEGETLSCGTGSVASALVASAVHGLSSPVQVDTCGGVLSVRFDSGWHDVWLSGLVSMVYEGAFSIETD